MDEERDLELVNDRFDDISIDDQPLDIASEAESDFDENEIKSQIDDCPRSLEYRKETRSKRNKPISDQMPTIAEERTLDCRSVLSNHSAKNSRFNAGTSKAGDPFGSSFNCSKDNFNAYDENSDDFSNQFQPGSVAVDQYEKEYFSEENRANALFPEDDLRFRGQNKFEKENSWEPSVVVYDRQPTPDIEQSPGMIFSQGNVEEKENLNKLDQSKVNKPSPSSDSNILFTSSPLSSSRLNTNTKTSTPKRPGGGRFGQRPQPQLEISTISSIHASSPNRVPPIFGATNVNSPCTSTTMMTNNTIGHSTIQNIFSKCKGGDILTALEMARKNKDILKPKIDFRRNATFNKTNSSTRTAAEPSIRNNPQNYDSSRITSSRTAPAPTENTRNVEVSSALESNSNIRNSQPTLCNNTSSRCSQRDFDGRSSVHSMRSVSRTSTHSTVSLATTTSNTDKCLKIHGKRLAFGVIDVGDSLTLDLPIENVSSRSIQIRCSLDSQTKVFQIKENSLALISPGASVNLRVSFTPESAGRYQLFLKVEVQGLNKRYTLPVWGCSGLARIEPVIEGELHPWSAKEYVMRRSKLTNITFKLKNNGKRDGFALIDVYDSMMKKVRSSIFPSNALMIRRQREKLIEIRLTESLPTFTDLRSTSSMSSVSSGRRSTLSGADLTIQIKWGEEIMRQRLKLLWKQKHVPCLVDGHDFIQQNFEGEEELRPTNGFPAIHMEDFNLFEAAYRTSNILVFSVRNSRQFDAYRSSSSSTSSASSFSDSTIMETTGFRNETFIRDVDATLMPRR